MKTLGTRTCVVGVGQAVAGDDGVGFIVLDELERRPLPGDVELVRLSETTDLVALLQRAIRLVLVDAVLARPTGAVVELGPEDLATSATPPISSHGMSAVQAILLAQAIAPREALRIRIVAVCIEPPDRLRVGLSQEVAKAVPTAVDLVLSRLSR